MTAALTQAQRVRLTLARFVCPASHIIAPREPTSAMLRAAAKAMSPDRRPMPEWVSCRKKHAIRYRAMMDAAQ